MFRAIIKKLSSIPVTFESWILNVLGIIFIRIFLEQYSNNVPGHFVLTDLSTIVQYSASFIALLLWSIGVLVFFSRKPLREIFAVTLFFFMIIWTPPLLDLILTAGKGLNIHYLLLSPREIIPAFLTLFWSTAAHGATWGIRIEIIICMMLSGIYIFIATNNMRKAVAAAVSFYAGTFFVFCIPSFFGLFQSETIAYFIKGSILDSLIVNNSVFSMSSSGMSRLLDIGFNSLMSQASLLFAFVSLAIISICGWREKIKGVLANARPERILHYSLLIVIGTLLSGGPSFFHSWVNCLSLCMTVIAFIFAWLSAVCVNDIYDKQIDTISNSSRPIPSGIFGTDEFRSLARIFFCISLGTAYSASLYGLFYVILFSAAYYVYSAEPLRIKRHFLGGIFSVGIACVSALSAGFFLGSANKELFAFPPSIVFSLFLIFGIGSMVKDLKDYEGDKAEGMRTLPVLLGLTLSKIIIGLILTAGFLTVAFFLTSKILIGLALIGSAFIWKTLLAQKFNEKHFFIIYIAGLVACLLALVFRF